MNSREQLASYLKLVEGRLRLGALLRGAAVVVSVALMTTVLLALVTNAFAFSDISFLFARVLLISALAAAAAYGLALPWRALNRRHAARKAELMFPQFDQSLVTFAERDRGGRDPFLELLAADALVVARSAAPATLVSDGQLAGWVACSAASLAVLLWLIVAGPGFLGYGAARLWAGSPSSATPFYEIRVSPGDAAVRRNLNQMIKAQIVGRQAEGARLYARYQSTSKWEQAEMQRQPEGAGFQFLFAGLPESVEYYVEAGSLRSRNFKLRVVDLPSVKQIRVNYHFPSWSGMKDSVEEHGGDLRAIEGTQATLNVLFSQPSGHAFLALDDGKQIDLVGGDHNMYQGAVRIEKDGLYHIATLDEGQPVRLSEDFFVEARKANPPEVRITRPAGEYHASPIEEVTVAVRASDDFGLNNVALHYSVNGGDERSIDLLKQKGAKDLEGSSVISLEDYKLVPGDLITLYATAKDAHAESHTDMTFIQAEPFARDYSQSQIMGGGGGGGMGGDQYQISQREKEIIAETWKHALSKGPSQQDPSEAAKFLSGVQAKLRDQALSLAGRLERRELTEENQEFSDFQKDMNAAAEAMNPASQALKQQRWKQAVPEEQKALQLLLRAEATFRQIQIAFSNQMGGGGGGGSGRDLQSLFDLELDTEKNQYETEQTASSANQRNAEVDKALQKLDELAHRQEQLAQQPRNPQDFQNRWEQEMLRREAEKLQEQMAQLARSGAQRGASGSSGQPSAGGKQSAGETPMQQALERLRQASEDMRGAASPQPSGADARRAADRLRQAADLVNGQQKQDAAERLSSVAREGQRLSDEQHAQADRLQRTLNPSEQAKQSGQGSSDSTFRELSSLGNDRQRLASDLASLEKEMQDTTSSLGAGQRSAASKLSDALSEMRQSDLRARVQRSAEMIRRGMNPSGNSGDPAIGAGLDRLNDQLHQAQQALSGEQQNPEEALSRAERLRSQIETLTRDLGGQGGQRGQDGFSEQGALARGGENMRNGAAGGINGGRWDGDRFYGGYDPGSLTRPQGAERKPVPITQADIERAYQEALRDLNELRQTVHGEPEKLGDIQELLRELSRLDPRRFPGNPVMIEQLHAQVLSSVDKIELQLRREMDGKQPGQVRSGAAMTVPDGYQESVARYFRQLSARPEQGK
jgi:hypothetical protein